MADAGIGTGDRLIVPERVIPVPTSVSHEAQAVLAMGIPGFPAYPDVDDTAAWMEIRAAVEDSVIAALAQMTMEIDDVAVEELDVDGITVFVADPPGRDAADPRVHLELHGGAFFIGGGECCRAIAIDTAIRRGMRVWAPDYRMPPQHSYPAALDDCMAVYCTLLKERRAEELVVSGGSSGGNLAAALILRARDEGFPLPAAAILLTPHVDLTESGDSFRTNLGVDTVLTSSPMNASLLYADGRSLRDPYLSPLFGDFTKGFPPSLLASSTRDLLLSSTVRMHRAMRAAGVVAELHILEAAPHGGFMANTPEDEDLEQEVRRFVASHCPS
ncbi:MAG TPA: alpha/beta hydrolase [Frankiaceae bacterium]|nr:alpha/beta hydrolase [Frankiaceae bacterium]